MLKTNYFFSGWIANLGVVPLFASMFFLLDPAFLAFSLLLVLVCCVFEAIIYSLSYLTNTYNRALFLSLLLLVVKIFITSTPSAIAESKLESKDIFLSKGEQIELTIGNIKSFSVGNREVLKYKHRPTKKTLLVRAKGIGFSDIVIWSAKNKKRIFRFYISSKKTHLKKMELAQILKNSNLKTKLSGDLLFVEGTLGQKKDFLLFKELEKKKEIGLFNVDLDHKLRNQIISEIYQDLYSQGAKYVYCYHIKVDILCDYEAGTERVLRLEHFVNDYKVKFTNLKEQKKLKNFKLKFKIVLIETLKTNMGSFGIDRLELPLNEMLNGNSKFQTDNVLYQDEFTTAKLASTPVIKTTLGNKFGLQLGGEIPFKQSSNNEVTTEWKFAGLKVAGKLSLMNDRFLLKYQSRFTSPGSDGVRGPKGESTLYLNPNKNIELFSIEFSNKHNTEASVPGLNRIPIIKELISAEESSHTNKKIVCFLELIEED